MYDNDTRFSSWLSEGGAAGVDPDFSGLGGFDGLGRRKRRGRRRAVAAPVNPATVPAVVRRRRRRAAAAALPSSVPVAVPVASAPAFNAAAADGFARAFNAAAAAAPAPEVVAVVPGSGAVSEPIDVSAPGDVSDADADVLTAAGEASADAPMDAETVDGLGKLKIGKAFKSLTKAALPIAAGIVLPAAGAAIGGALISATSAKGAKGAAAKGKFSIKDAFGNFINDVAGRVGDALVDAAGNVVARQSGGQWVKVGPSIGEADPAAPGRSGGGSISWPVLIAAGVGAYLLLGNRRG